MKVLKFGGTSVGSAERIRHVADLVSARGKNIIVLSAMSGTTNSLVEISDYLYKKNTNGAKETINLLESKYLKTIASLYDRHESREKALKEIKACFNYIRSFTQRETFGPTEEKIILAQGEIMSVAMMTILLNERGLYAEALPALDFMKTGQNGEPDMQHIALHLQPLLDKYVDADIFVTQGFICRNSTGEIDNLQRGGSDYTASLIGAAIEADEIEIWTISTACTTTTLASWKAPSQSTSSTTKKHPSWPTRRQDPSPHLCAPRQGQQHTSSPAQHS